MVNCPVPTYLIGVDEPGGIAFLAPVHPRGDLIDPDDPPPIPANLKRS